MRITGVRAYALPFAFTGGGYRTSYGARTHLNNLLIELRTDSGSVGYSEVARLTGKSVEPTDKDFVSRLRVMLEPVLGRDASAPDLVVTAMGPLPEGFTNVAAAVDTACWDLKAKQGGVPLCDLIGGRRRDSIPCYHSVGQNSPERMAAAAAGGASAGHRVLQMKVGDSIDADCARVQAVLDAVPEDTIVLPDANGGWDIATASSVFGQFTDPRLMWEEPCSTYAENRALAEKTGARLVLDQCMKRLGEYEQACRDGFAAGCGLKPAFQGGISNSVAARDLCVESGIALKIDDSWGADATTAAALHLALGVVGDLLLCGVDMRIYFDRRYAEDGPDYRPPDLYPGAGPGLGITPDTAGLGPPVLEMVWSGAQTG